MLFSDENQSAFRGKLIPAQREGWCQSGSTPSWHIVVFLPILDERCSPLMMHLYLYLKAWTSLPEYNYLLSFAIGYKNHTVSQRSNALFTVSYDCTFELLSRAGLGCSRFRTSALSMKDGVFICLDFANRGTLLILGCLKYRSMGSKHRLRCSDLLWLCLPDWGRGN